MKIASISIVILSFFTLVLWIDLDLIILEGINLSSAQSEPFNKTKFFLLFFPALISSLVLVFTVNKFLLALNIISIITMIILIFRGMSFLFQQKDQNCQTSIYQSIFQRFSIRFDF